MVLIVFNSMQCDGPERQCFGKYNIRCNTNNSGKNTKMGPIIYLTLCAAIVMVIFGIVVYLLRMQERFEQMREVFTDTDEYVYDDEQKDFFDVLDEKGTYIE